MVAHKRFFIIAALSAMAVAGSAADGFAQARRGRGPVRAVIVAPVYRPYYGLWGYDPWFDDFQWGGIYGPYGPYSPYRHYNVDPGGSVRIEVKPNQTEVYVDGYYAGIVDDFDGTFQRLRIPPGEHEIELYLEGYRTVREKIYLVPDKTFKLNRDMEKLAPGEQPEPKPQPMYPPQSAGPGGQMAPGPGGQAGPGQGGQQPYGPPPSTRPRRGPSMPPPSAPRDPRDSRAPEASAYGTLSVRIQPGTADLVIDGEKWRGPEGQERIFIELPEGRHTVEVQKQGYRTYVTDVDVRRGETTPLNVSLRNQE